MRRSYDNNIMLWHGVIFGSSDTPWDGGARDCSVCVCKWMMIFLPTTCIGSIGSGCWWWQEDKDSPTSFLDLAYP
ncbi:Ubiquitin-conjugating enzyme E2 2 [Camellia lanceoleosa]|uniref:Ubiquitin-conjugating enzyme E2 2 n=1 Tax=Camellia lanceoleosa TaxID=1840588 RepID=A0ACC0G3L6_9ERIC|nr:Ubiquitin-conjugating enzyme E2 2 [Camellia lanceoleosa]